MLSAFLDSGLAGNLISQSMVSALSIPVVKLASPISVNALDGNPLVIVLLHTLQVPYV